MKIAISTDGDFVSAHFGRCPVFTIIDVDNNQVMKKETIQNPGHHPGFLPEFLKNKGVNYIIAGGIGGKAQTLFVENNIKAIMGVSGKVDDIIKEFLKGTLQGGESLCKPGVGKGYGMDKSECDHSDHHH